VKEETSSQLSCILTREIQNLVKAVHL